MKRTVALLCAVVGALLLPVPAFASPQGSKPVSAGDDKRSAECSDMAEAAHLAQWFCVGGNVYDALTGEQKSSNQVQRRRDVSDGVSPKADDWDWWCEDQVICDRQINDYIMETKANYEWGVIDSNGN